jgi:hypothetical protein
MNIQEASMVRKIGLVILLTAFAGLASAHEHREGQETCKIEKLFGFFPIEVCTHSGEPKTVTAPEIDSTSAIAGLTLMAGGLAVLRGRRSKTAKA